MAMKKNYIILIIFTILFSACNAPKIKQGVSYAKPHGKYAFAVIAVTVLDDVIEAVYIDEFQYLNEEGVVAVPNGYEESGLGGHFFEGEYLASKKINNDIYSKKMAGNGATVKIEDNFNAIESYAVGKKIKELEKEIFKYDEKEMIDAVSGATLKDTRNYLKAVLDTAKSAK